MNPPNQPEPKQDLKNFQVETKPDGQGEVGLRDRIIGYLITSMPGMSEEYRKFAEEAADEILSRTEADKTVAVRAERERVFEGTSKAIHDTYFSVLNGIANGLAASLPDTANKIRMIADKARKDMLDDLIAEAAQSRLQPPTAGEGERGKA